MRAAWMNTTMEFSDSSAIRESVVSLGSLV